MNRFTNAAIAIFLLAISSFALANDRYQIASASIAKDDEGYFNLLVLFPDIPAIENFCGKQWSYGFLQSKIKSSMHNNAYIPAPGCWASSGSDAETATIEFRYMLLDGTGVHSFTEKASNFRKYTFDQEAGQLMPYNQSLTP